MGKWCFAHRFSEAKEGLQRVHGNLYTSDPNLPFETRGAMPSSLTPTRQMSLPATERDTVVKTAPETRTDKPPMYKVKLLNDDFTPMDFVVQVLTGVFNKSHKEAVDLMLAVHNQGAAVCGVYTRDVAETKVDEVLTFAHMHEHPLQCVMEKD